jgi:OmpA-OmpF porin, OOP family
MRRQFAWVWGSLVVTACGGTTPAADTPPDEGDSPKDSAAAPESSETEPSATEEEEEPLGGDAPSEEFQLRDSTTAKDARGSTPSQIKATKTHAAMKFVVVDKDKGPIPGIVIALTDPKGTKYFTEETDSTGYAEVLVPNAQKYDLVYVSLGQRDIAASVDVTGEANQNIRLTLRYKGYRAAEGEAQHFVLDGVTFDTGKATIRPESFARLDRVVEYMTHKKQTRIEVSGHTDNVGNPVNNQKLSEKRAQACRDYIVSKGIDASRVQAKGYGDTRPIASNDSDDGRQKNRRIEATEL